MAALDFLKKESKKAYSPVGRFSGEKKVREAMGEVDNKNRSSWNKKIGEEHPFDPRITEGMIKKYGLAAGIVDKYLNYIWGQGFSVTCDEPDGKKAIKIINDFNKEVGINVKGRAWIKEALVKPGGYFEIEKSGNKISGLKILDGKHMYVKRDNKGKILGYSQYIPGVTKNNEPIPFTPDQIIALHYNVVGDMAYGLGILWQNIGTLNDLIGLEKDMHQLIKRKANAPLHIKIGVVGSEGVVDMPTPEQIDQVRDDLETMTSTTEYVTDATWDMKVVDFGKLAEKFDVPLKHDVFRLVVGFKMPEVIMGAGNIAEGLAGEQGDDWERTITTMQEQAEEVLEGLYRRVLQENGLDMRVEVVWGQPTNKEKAERIQALLSVMGAVQPAFRFELEKQLAELMGVDPELLEEPTEEKDVEDGESQPNVPGDKNPKSSLVTESTEIDPFREDATIKEWLGFDYEEYTKHIIDAAKVDAFALLAAADKVQELAGLLSQEQIERLREVLVDGFKQGKSIKSIASSIKEQVAPGDAYEITPEGKRGRLLNYEANRVYSIARSETSRLANLGSRSFYRDNEIKDYRWVAAVGRRTCPTCEGMNGKMFPINSVTLPPLHPMCRCTIVPVLKNG